ncbi:MAG: hypothetical protein HY820_20305 [Acidobacteria bacterium]|nr:hypothetical protein [Acidobacteriota bacterium]
MPTTAIVSTVLSNIEKVTRISSGGFDGGRDWFHLESKELRDAELYEKLRANWRQITGQYLLSFALVYCREGADCGVWLHYLHSAQHKSEYLPGCHSVPSWF